MSIWKKGKKCNAVYPQADSSNTDWNVFTENGNKQTDGDSKGIH